MMVVRGHPNNIITQGDWHLKIIGDDPGTAMFYSEMTLSSLSS